MDLLRLTVPGDPIPKGRPRTGNGRVYTPARTRDAEDVVRVLARQAYGPRPPFADAVGIEVTFFCATRRRTDGDNLLKLITDGLQRGRRPTGGVIVDDDQIEEWQCRLFRAAPGEAPRTEVRLYALAHHGGEEGAHGAAGSLDHPES